MKDLKQLGLQRLENKKQRMSNLLKIANPDEALYREIMLSLGYKNNKIPFLELATLLPYSEIKQLSRREIIEQAMLYRAGLSDEKNLIPDYFDFSLRMTKDVWTYKATRPANFPERRIEQVSYLLADTVESGLFMFFKKRIEGLLKNDINQSESKKIVKQIMSFDGIGEERKVEIFFNIILPFYLVTFQDSEKLQIFLMKIIETHPALKKRYKMSQGEKEINSMLEYFGLIEITKK